MKNIIKKWWFWLVVVICVIIITYTGNLNNNKQQVLSTSENNQTSNNTNRINDNENVKKNPYIETNEYDGIYKFVINNESNVIVGAININGGNLETKFSNIDNSSIVPVYKGFCGLSKEDNTTFYISIKNSAYETIREFKCTKSDKNLSGESLTLTNYKNVDFVYVNDNEDIENVYNEVLKQEKEKKEAEEKAKKEKEEQDFKSSCQTYTYEQIARNPENFKGTNVKLTGEVVQVIYGTYSTDLRVNITKEGRYSTYYTDTVYVTYYPKAGEDKILEDDIITIYGTAQGDYSYTSTLGATITLPMIQGKYITIEK